MHTSRVLIKAWEILPLLHQNHSGKVSLEVFRRPAKSPLCPCHLVMWGSFCFICAEKDTHFSHQGEARALAEAPGKQMKTSHLVRQNQWKAITLAGRGALWTICAAWTCAALIPLLSTISAANGLHSRPTTEGATHTHGNIWTTAYFHDRETYYTRVSWKFSIICCC